MSWKLTWVAKRWVAVLVIVERQDRSWCATQQRGSVVISLISHAIVDIFWFYDNHDTLVSFTCYLRSCYRFLETSHRKKWIWVCPRVYDSRFSCAPCGRSGLIESIVIRTAAAKSVRESSILSSTTYGLPHSYNGFFGGPVLIITVPFVVIVRGLFALYFRDQMMKRISRETDCSVG